VNLCNQLGYKGLEKTRKRPRGYSLVFSKPFRSNALQIFFAFISRIQVQDKNGISAGGRTADNFRYDEGRGAVVGDAEGGFDDPVFHGVQDFSRLELV